MLQLEPGAEALATGHFLGFSYHFWGFRQMLWVFVCFLDSRLILLGFCLSFFVVCVYIYMREYVYIYVYYWLFSTCAGTGALCIIGCILCVFACFGIDPHVLTTGALWWRAANWCRAKALGPSSPHH